MNKYKIIFLDIDGVLNSRDFAIRHYNETGKGLLFKDFLDQEAVEKLYNYILHKPDIRLVISSSWRRENLLQTIYDFQNNGMSKLSEFIIGVTPRMKSGRRGEEIQWFLDNVGKDKDGIYMTPNFEIESYVFLDDEVFDYLDSQLPYHVKTDYQVGITNNEYNKIEEILYQK